MLFLPGILAIAAVLLNRQQQAYGGTARLLRSALLETLIALRQASGCMAAGQPSQAKPSQAKAIESRLSCNQTENADGRKRLSKI
jgi:hypothetical protein